MGDADKPCGVKQSVLMGSADRFTKETKVKSPNCYECKHRKDLGWSAHSECKHPAYGSAGNAALALVATLHASLRGGPIAATNGGISVKGNPHGIANGWFMHPLNFDPVWLEECSGFEAKQSTAVSGAISQAVSQAARD